MVTSDHKPLRIAMLSIHSSPIGPLGTLNTGGMSVYVRELARWLGHQGHRVDIFTYVHDPRHDIDLYPNVRLIHLNRNRPGELNKAKLPNRIESIFKALENRRHGHHTHYDIIHSHYWISAVVGVMAQSRWHCPHLIMFHTLGAAKNHTGASEDEPIRRIAHERWLAKVADGIVVPSGVERQNLLCHYHPPPEIIHTIPCGVNLDRFKLMDPKVARRAAGIPLDARVALYVGRFAPVKGLDNLIGAMDLLQNQLPDLRLILVGGDGPDAESTRILKRQVSRRQLEKQVVFAGRIDQKSLPIYYSAADFLALPSYYESFGLVMLEALACGTPVVATPVGAAHAIVKKGINGVVADAPDRTALARAITEMMNTPNISRKKIHSTAAAFTWEQIAAEMTKTYSTLLRRCSPTAQARPAEELHAHPNRK